MKITLDTEDPKEMEKLTQFLKELAEAKAAEKAEVRKKVLKELFSKPRIHLPADYKFSREELYDRPHLR